MQVVSISTSGPGYRVSAAGTNASAIALAESGKVFSPYAQKTAVIAARFYQPDAHVMAVLPVRSVRLDLLGECRKYVPCLDFDVRDVMRQARWSILGGHVWRQHSTRGSSNILLFFEPGNPRRNTFFDSILRIVSKLLFRPSYVKSWSYG